MDGPAYAPIIVPFCRSLSFEYVYHLGYRGSQDVGRAREGGRGMWNRRTDAESPGPPLTEKEQAIASVLPLLHAHHDLICRVKTSLERVTPPSGPLPPRAPEPDEELWVLREAANRRRYRLDALARSLEDLAHCGRPGATVMLNALCCTYIEPFDRYLPERQRLTQARAGLRFLATTIHGVIPAYDPLATAQSLRGFRDEQIRKLLARGDSMRRIAQKLGCSTATVQAAKANRALSHGRLRPAAAGTSTPTAPHR